MTEFALWLLIAVGVGLMLLPGQPSELHYWARCVWRRWRGQ